MGSNLLDIISDIALKKVDASILELLGEGGSGKTTLIENTMFNLLEKKEIEGKTIIPVYVSMKLASDGVFAYIRENYLIDIETKKTFGELLEKLNKYTNQYIYVIILDAINESPYGIGRLKAELTKLFSYASSSFIVVYSIRASATSFLPASYVEKKLRLECEPLAEDVVKGIINTQLKGISKNIVENLKWDDHVKEVLSRPFYLAQYIRILTETDTNTQKDIKIDEYHIIDAFIDAMLEKTKNPLESLKTLEGFIGKSCEYRLNNQLSRIELTMKEKTLLVEDLGILVAEQNGDTYSFRHENYLDYFYIRFIVERIHKQKYIFPKSVDEPIKIKTEPLKMLSFALFDRNIYKDENYSWEYFKDIVGIPNKDFQFSNKLLQNSCSNLAEIIYAFLENLDNGTDEKADFCLKFSGVSKEIFSFIKVRLDIIKVDGWILELLRIQAEILRRSYNFADSISIFDLLSNNGMSQDEVDHNKAKIYLYEGYKEIIESGELENANFNEGMVMLSNVADNGFVLARNLYSLLLGFPVPPLGAEKRDLLEAFKINWQSVKANYNANNRFYYPLSQCYSALIRGDVELKKPVRADLKYIVENIENTDFVPTGQSGNKAYSETVIEEFYKVLGDEKESYISLNAKYKLLWHNDLLEAVECAKKSSSLPLSRFILAIYSNDVEALETIKMGLLNKVKCRSVDVFDVVYVQQDLNVVWSHFIENFDNYKRKYDFECSEEFKMALNAVDSLLSVDLRMVR